MAYSITWERLMVYARFWGDVSVAEFMQANECICGDERFDNLRFAINDFLSIDSQSFASATTTSDIEAVSIGASFTNPYIRVVVITTDNRIIDMVRCFEANRSDVVGHSVVQFPDLASAKGWMQAQPDAVGIPRWFH